ncbi:MAG: hypothetical protein U0R27_03435 [Candidatus Nanopelagicales bacterium]|nr:hypothetical protein [Actinomycetota bacterium]MCB0920911.1 hypothetical protein [Actinomycetota bacterium]
MSQRAGGRVVVVVIVLLQVLQVLSLAAWLFAILFAGAALSEDQANAGTFAFVAAVFGYPLWLVGLGVASWVLVRRQERGWALFVAVIASLPVLTLLGVTLFAA